MACAGQGVAMVTPGPVKRSAERHGESYGA
jgi:hypothetical protein